MKSVRINKSAAHIITGVGIASLIAMSTAFAGGGVDKSETQASSDSASSGQQAETISQTSANAASANASQAKATTSSRTASKPAELPQTTAARQKNDSGFEAIENDELVIDTSSIADVTEWEAFRSSGRFQMMVISG